MNKIYEKESYVDSINTVVTESGQDEKGYYICLDETIFFPEEGGQYADTGSLEYNGITVRLLDGQISGGNIKYYTSELIPKDTLVLCKLDWKLRYDRMQNHSGEHILTGVIHNKYGFNNVGFHLSDDGFVTLNLDGVLTYEQVIEMEKSANEVIYKNMPITDTYPTKDELKNIEYRSKIEIEGQVRLITVGDGKETVDVCACCAPHVKRTGEIGIIKVISVINFKGGIQISMLCGRRALEYINVEHEILMKTARSLSTAITEVPVMVNAHKEELTELRLMLNREKENAAIRDTESDDFERFSVIFASGDFPKGSMKNVYNVMCDKKDGYVGFFVGSDSEGYQYNAGIKDGDSRELAKLLREELGAKGGGSPEMIQGRLNVSKSKIESFFERINS